MDIFRLCSTFYLLVMLSMVNSEVISRKWERNDSSSSSSRSSSGDGNSGLGLGGIRSVSTTNDNRDRRDFRGANVRRVKAALTANEDAARQSLSEQPHSRKKRLIWITDDGRLALPPGTVLSITPTLSLPLVRHPPEGFLSNITMSFPLTIDFDKLGLTDNENPLGVIPPVFGRSMGRAAGSMLANYIGDYLRRRDKRSADNENSNDYLHTAEAKESIVELPEQQRHAFHGGERAILYGVVEDLIATFGMNGKACLLRAICESHSRSMDKLGLIGEFVKLFFTASKSDYAELLTEYVEAERVGRGEHGPGECFPYHKECPKSFFRSPSHKYSESAATEHMEHHNEESADAENIIDLNGIEKDIIDQTSNKLNGKYFKM